MSSMNFEQAHQPVTLYGRTINFQAREIMGQTLFVPRHITFDVTGMWKITLNNKATYVTVGEDLHYSLNVAWKELKRRMSEELPPKRKQPRFSTVQNPRKRIDTGVAGVGVYVHMGRVQVTCLQSVNRVAKRRTIDTIAVKHLNQAWLNNTLYEAALVRQHYEDVVKDRQLRDIVTLDDVPEGTRLHKPLKRVTVQQVLDEYKRITGEELFALDASLGNSKVAPEWVKEGKIHIELERPKEWGKAEVSTPALTFGRWLLKHLIAFARGLASLLERQQAKLK